MIVRKYYIEENLDRENFWIDEEGLVIGEEIAFDPNDFKEGDIILCIRGEG